MTSQKHSLAYAVLAVFFAIIISTWSQAQTMAPAAGADNEPDSHTLSPGDGAKLEKESIALGHTDDPLGLPYHRFVFSRSWSIGMRLASEPPQPFFRSAGATPFWKVAAATMPPSLPWPSPRETRSPAFWPNSLKLALMNEDVLLRALPAFSLELQERRLSPSSADYWNWNWLDRAEQQHWPLNVASEIHSLGYIPPPK